MPLPMPILPTNLGASVSGTAAAQRTAADRKADRPGAPRVRPQPEDELITSPDAVAASRRIRGLKGNEQEESHEDRREHRGQPGTPRPRLDVSG
jgi:hypothetical protein